MAAGRPNTRRIASGQVVSMTWVLWGLLTANSSLAQQPQDSQETQHTGAAQQTSALLSHQVQVLCQQLDSNLLAERVQAEDSLVRLGPRILPLLPDYADTGSVAVRQAVERVRLRLESQHARDSVLPSRITLHGTFSLAELLDQIAGKTGNRIDASAVVADRLRRTLTVDFDGTEFWRAMDQIARSQELGYQPSDQQRVLRLVSRPDTSDAAADVGYFGAFRVVARCGRLRDVAGQPDRKVLPVTFEIRAEPRLHVLTLKYAESDFVAITPEGTRLTAFSPEARSELPVGSGHRQILFVAPGKPQPRHVSLQGRFRAETAAGSEVFGFAHAAKALPATQQRGGVRVTLDEMQWHSTSATQRRLRVRITVVYDRGGSAFQSHRTWMLHNDVWLEDADGTRIPCQPGFETQLQADGVVGVVYQFEGLRGREADYRFVYSAPTLLVEVPVTCTFRDLVVPEATARGKPRSAGAS